MAGSGERVLSVFLFSFQLFGRHFIMLRMTTNEKIMYMRRRILSWFRRNGRDLPWRRTADPWRILVSEVMLQQTQVERVVPKYSAFIARWPTPSSLAASPLSAALRAWSGLGYNRRAANLWKAARIMADEQGGRVPASLAGLEALPGIGRYTARAVAAFARNESVAACDTNIRRVMTRFFFGGEFADAPEGSDLEAMLAAAVPAGRSRDWHGALMDFGSAVCVSRAPACAACPLAGPCRAAPDFLAGKTVVRRPARPQAKFEGSRRQVRGLVLKALSEVRGGLSTAALAERLGRNSPSGIPAVREAVEALADDGLVKRGAGKVSLP
jgi:A/G-specific adenine glycosylase